MRHEGKKDEFSDYMQAYYKSQPKPVFHVDEPEEGEEED